MKKRGYTILGKNKNTNQIIGCVENSLSMSFNDCFTKVWLINKKITEYSKEYHSEHRREIDYRYLRQLSEKYNKENSDYEFKVFRIGSKHCPVKIDWTIRISYKKKILKKITKYEFRNLPFTIKEGVNF